MQELNLCLREVKLDLRRGTIECNKRGLQQSAKWLAEINFSLPATGPASEEASATPAGYLLEADIAPSELDRYYMAKAYFDCREYDRAAFFLADCQSPVPRFLRYYATYMAREKRKLEKLVDGLESDIAALENEKEELLASINSGTGATGSYSEWSARLEVVEKLIKLGFSVCIESGAGAAANLGANSPIVAGGGNVGRAIHLFARAYPAALSDAQKAALVCGSRGIVTG